MGAAALTHLDICSGVGGFALAAQWAGYTTVGFVEIDSFCRRVLAKHWPGVPQHDDLKTLTAATVRDWIGSIPTGADVADARCFTQSQEHPIDDDAIFAARSRAGGGNGGRDFASGVRRHRANGDGGANDARLDLLTAGYPCQPFSLAGQRMGAEDDRHLWPFIAALVADLRPRRCLFENVYGHVSMGLDAVLSDLEALGYACGAVVVPACAVGAPHRRDRVWILAELDANAAGIREREPADEANPVATGGDTWAITGGRGGDVADAAARGLRRGESPGETGLAARGGEADADADRAGLEGWIERPERAGERAAGALVGEPLHHTGAGPEALSGLDSETHGVSRRLSGRSAARPAGWNPGPGVIDPWAGDWEAGMPRTTTHEHDRTHKLKALGNAVLPQIPYTILRFWGQP